MRAAIAEWLPFILSGLTIAAMWLAGAKHPRAWLVGLGNQALWLVWIVAADKPGFLPMNVALWIVYARNHLKWNC